MKILIYDIESSPSIGAFFNPYKKGNILWTEQERYMMSFAYKWYGEKRTYVRALPDYKLYKTDPTNDIELVKELHNLFNEADIIIGHNGDKFDNKVSNARFIYHKLSPPPPHKTIDTLKAARKHFKFESNRLGQLGVHLGLGDKEETGGIDLWRDCMDGKRRAWRKMKKYNKQDVVLLEKVYDRLKPWRTVHPVVHPGTPRDKCPVCQSQNIRLRGKAYNAKTYAQRYSCRDCGKWWQGNNIKYET